MLTALDAGHAVTELLGLEQAITSPWSTELPTYLSYPQISERFGGMVDPDVLLQTQRLGLVRL